MQIRIFTHRGPEVMSVKVKRKDTQRLVSVVVLGGRDETEFLAAAASLASAGKHPLGAAIIHCSLEHHVEFRQVDRVRALAGAGVTGLVDGHDVTLGNSALFAELGLSLGDLDDWAERLALQGQRITFVAVDGETAGFVGMTDPPPDGRPDMSKSELSGQAWP
jgi:cation transport ATPase